nr:DUF3231 family protein [Bacillus sp. X1(2014)]
MDERIIKLTSSEIASLWTSYMNNSMSIQILNYFLRTVEDSEVRSIIEKGRSISDEILAKITEIYQQEISLFRMVFQIVMLT